MKLKIHFWIAQHRPWDVDWSLTEIEDDKEYKKWLGEDIRNRVKTVDRLIGAISRCRSLWKATRSPNLS